MNLREVKKLIETVRNDTLEEAAKVADGYAGDLEEFLKDIARSIGQGIRALKREDK